MLDERNAKVVISKRKDPTKGGNTSKINIPTLWANEMGISEDDRDVLLIFDKENKIIEVTKVKKD